MASFDQGDASNEGQRRYVSLLFADVCDFSELSEATDPEDAESLKREIEALASSVMQRHRGAVSQVYGEGILAVFGLPDATEDDARHAIEAALELHAATRKAAFEGKLPAGFELRLRTGVHAGLVFSRPGNELHGQYELTGDTVSTAARLCSVAGRDEILVSSVALRGCDEFFDTRPVAELELRGKRAKVPAHVVTGRSGLRTSFEARSRRGLTRFAGRRHELAQLGLAMREAQEGRSACLLVIGDAGIGKSRLLEQLRLEQSPGEFLWLRGCCDSYGETRPLEPFLQVLVQAIELPAIGDVAASIASVDSRLERSETRVRAHRETLLRLLGLMPWPEGSSELPARMRAAVQALIDLVRTLASRVPVVLALDDWQWADDASRHVVVRMHEALVGERVCILLAAREGGEEQALLKPDAVIRLGPFSQADSREVVRALRPADLETELIRALHAWSGGNPLFLEELCRSLPEHTLGDGGALERGDVPHTLQGVIQSRVAALPGPQLTLLRAAAVIGIEFAHGLLHAALPAVELDATLDSLLAQDLIYRGEREGVFRFKHGITRDVIYESVRIAERKRLHALVAAAIEQAPAAASEQAETLAYHHRHTGNHRQAAAYAELAGDKAMSASSLDRARFHYAAAMDALDRLPPEPEVARRWLAISSKWANPCSYNPVREQLATLERASRCARELDDRVAQSTTEYYLGWFYYVFGDYERCVQAYQRALGLAQASGDPKQEAQVYTTLGQAHAAAGRYATALPLLTRGIEDKRVRKRSHERAWNLAHALGCRALVYADRGQFAEAEADFAAAFAIVEGTGHAMEASLLAQHAMSYMRQGLWHESSDAAARCRRAAARTNSGYVLAMSEAFEAYGQHMLAPNDAALKQLRRAIDWLLAREHGLYVSVVHACAAEAHCMTEDFETARVYAMRALSRAEQGDLLGQAAAYRALAAISAPRAGFDAAEFEVWIRKAIHAGDVRASPRETALTRLLAREARASARDSAPAPTEAEALALEFERMQMPWYAARARRLTARG